MSYRQNKNNYIFILYGILFFYILTKTIKESSWNETISAALSEDSGTLEDVVEQF